MNYIVLHYSAGIICYEYFYCRLHCLVETLWSYNLQDPSVRLEARPLGLQTPGTWSAQPWSLGAHSRALLQPPGAGVCRPARQPAGPKRQAGGTPTRVADTWRLAVKPRRWAGHAQSCSHLTLGLPGLGRLCQNPIDLGPASGPNVLGSWVVL
jgi:hypothetical protein